MREAGRGLGAGAGGPRSPIPPAGLALLACALGCAHLLPSDPCRPLASALAESSFVVVTQPRAGRSVASPLRVRGCSRTFESNVVWKLHGRRGRVLAWGHTTGGGVAGPAPFSFTAEFRVPAAELAHLEVFEPDASDGEGFPGGRTVLPLVLQPGPD